MSNSNLIDDDKPSKWKIIVKVFSYVIRHPYSSLRLVNVYRLKKLYRIVFKENSTDAKNWIASRFPADKSAESPVIFPVVQSNDEIELEFLKSNSVSVSIVIPVFNQYRTTISCLQALFSHTGGVGYEVIIADDCSTDITSTIESRVKNIRVVRQAENKGFLKNCNNAIAQAKGKYIALLNNDTNVQKNWLQPLITLIEQDPQVGMVGPKFIFEDGGLQEAGGIIWQDASGWNYGRGQAPNLPEFNFVRETDYLSGACLLFEKSVWDKIGGFDERFCPAYYEDTDLAFEMRRLGLKVLYQPASVVVHFEGVSNGVSISSGIKKHQKINQEVFREKWHSELDRRHYPNAVNVFQARERSEGKRTVVFIDHYVPFYDKDAGSRSTFTYIKSMLKMGINVKFIPANFFPHQPYTSELQQLGVEVLYGEQYARGWKSWLKDNCKHIDIIYLHRPHVTEGFIDFLTSLEPTPKLIYFGHDLHYLRASREAEISGDKAILSSVEVWKKLELSIFNKVDKVYYPSEEEVKEVKKIAPNTDVTSIPLYLLEQPSSDKYVHNERSGLLFVGGFGHPPNIDAVVWFVEEVMPRILKIDPTICLHVVGSNVPNNIQSLQNDNVKIHGFLSDQELNKLYQQVRISVAPLRFGAGVKGKILEAIQAGLPIVTTPIGAEGIPVAERVMSISDSAIEMAESIINMNNDEQRCKTFIKRYADYIQSYFSKTSVQEVITRDFLN